MAHPEAPALQGTGILLKFRTPTKQQVLMLSDFGTLTVLRIWSYVMLSLAAQGQNPCWSEMAIERKSSSEVDYGLHSSHGFASEWQKHRPTTSTGRHTVT